MIKTLFLFYRMDTSKRHLPVSGEEGLNALREMAQKFEEKIYTVATNPVRKQYVILQL